MGYVLEFKDERHLDDVMEKMAKAKKSVMEACEALEAADNGMMSERNRYRNMRGHYRDDWEDMNYRGGRYY